MLGQCSKIVHLKEPYKGLEMSTKRIFDDMYLFLKDANDAHGKDMSIIDEMNGLPQQSYQEVTSQYWNLIYKHPEQNHYRTMSQGTQYGYGKNNNRAQSLNIVGIEKEYQES